MGEAVKMRIVVEKPPGGIDYALQKGSGNTYEAVQVQRSANDDLSFEFEARMRGQGKNVALGGPFVQGPSGAKFVYIDIGTYAGQKNTQWARRLKVPLTGISPTMISRAANHTNSVLEARVPGTDKKGEPSCATVKPFAGWKLAR